MAIKINLPDQYGKISVVKIITGKDNSGVVPNKLMPSVLANMLTVNDLFGYKKKTDKHITSQSINKKFLQLNYNTMELSWKH